MNWTKKDIRSLCGTIDTFVLVNRPLRDSRSDAEAAEVKVRDALSRHRQDVVLSGVREARDRASGRYRQACETIGNQIVRFQKQGESDELVDRFTKLAREYDAEHRALEAMVHRILAEGLPREVVAYDPYAKEQRSAATS